jgi:RNA polymerase sigma-70 factor (ECF subfamily)
VKGRGFALRLVKSGSGAALAEPSDEDVIRAFARGDLRDAELLYVRLIGVVDSILYKVLGRREPEHDDLVQAAFEQIIVTLTRKTYAGGCSLAGWAAVIASHIGLNTIRSRKRARRVFALEADTEDVSAEAEGHADVEAQVMARREVDRLRHHLSEMDPGRAQTILVHDVFGHSLTETARLTGVTMSAAQSRLVRGRRELRARMLGPKEDR